MSKGTLENLCTAYTDLLKKAAAKAPGCTVPKGGKASRNAARIRKAKAKQKLMSADKGRKPKTLVPIKPGNYTEKDVKKLAKWSNGTAKDKYYYVSGEEGGLWNVQSEEDIPNLFVEKRKAQIANMLSKRTGMSERVTSDFVREWAVSSNQEYGSMLTQHRAAKMFGTKISSWQRTRLAEQMAEHSKGMGKTAFESSSGVLEKTVINAGYKTNEEAIDACLNAVYDETQSSFRAAGITQVRLFRGMEDYRVRKTLLGKKMTLGNKANALESWTTDRTVAWDFADDGSTFVADVPVERILSTHKTGFGCSGECEFVVIGHEDDIVVPTWTAGVKHPPKLSNDLSGLPMYGE